MKQQIYEEALKAIVRRLNETPSTYTHDREGDRRRANQALAAISKIAREAIGQP